MQFAKIIKTTNIENPQISEMSLYTQECFLILQIRYILQTILHEIVHLYKKWTNKKRHTRYLSKLLESCNHLGNILRSRFFSSLFQKCPLTKEFTIYIQFLQNFSFPFTNRINLFIYFDHDITK